MKLYKFESTIENSPLHLQVIEARSLENAIQYGHEKRQVNEKFHVQEVPRPTAEQIADAYEYFSFRFADLKEDDRFYLNVLFTEFDYQNINKK